MPVWTRIAALVATLVFGGTPALSDDEAPEWGTVGIWSVRVDPSLDNGCFLFAAYEGGTALRLGIDPTRRYNGYLMVGNEQWTSLEVGKDYKLTIRFDDEDAWEASATAVDMSGMTMLYLSFSESGFLDEFMRKHALYISYNGTAVDSLKLTSSAKAGAELLRCQSTMQGSGKQTSDPFAPGKKAASDPFAR